MPRRDTPGADGVRVRRRGLGKGGTVTLYLDGVNIGEGQVAATAPMIFSADDGCDVGVENGALVADDYRGETRSPGR